MAMAQVQGVYFDLSSIAVSPLGSTTWSGG